MALVMSWFGGGGTSGTAIPRYPDPNTALVVLDLQRDFLAADGRNPIAGDQVFGVLATTNAVLGRATVLGLEVVYVGNEFPADARIANLFRRGAAIKGSAGAALDPRVQIVGDQYFAKAQGDAFSNMAFDEHLRARHVSRIVVAGVFADQCVYATVRGALNRRYDVIVLRDAIGAGSEGARERTARDLRRRGVQMMTSTEFLTRLGSDATWKKS